MKSVLIIAVALSFMLTMVGAVFKIQSWPGGEVFLLTGVILLPLAVIGIAIYKATQSKKITEEKLDLNTRPSVRKPEKKVLPQTDEDSFV